MYPTVVLDAVVAVEWHGGVLRFVLAQGKHEIRRRFTIVSPPPILLYEQCGETVDLQLLPITTTIITTIQTSIITNQCQSLHRHVLQP